MIDSSNDLGLQLSLRKTRAAGEVSGRMRARNLIEIPGGLGRRFIILA